MKIARWGNSLAVRLPRDLTETLGLKEGDDVDFRAVSERSFEVSRQTSREEALKRLRKFRGLMPADFKFDRDEANAR
jgi:antitoxin MazE